MANIGREGELSFISGSRPFDARTDRRSVFSRLFGARNNPIPVPGKQTDEGEVVIGGYNSYLDIARERLTTPEKKLVEVRSVEPKDFTHLLTRMWSDSETVKHFDPPPPQLRDRSHEELVIATLELQRYLFNGGEPHKLLAVVGVNAYDIPIAYGENRFRGRMEEVMYGGGHDIRRVPFFGHVTVDPELQAENQVDENGNDTGVRYEVGTYFAASVIEHNFKVGYSPRKGGLPIPQRVMRIWIMVDVSNPPIRFWERLGFEKLPGDYNKWKAAQGIKTERGNAYKYELTADGWEEIKKSGVIDPGRILPIKQKDIFSNGGAYSYTKIDR